MFKHRIIEGPGDSHAAVIELAGSFESRSAREFRTAVDACLEGGARDLIIDLEHVHFMGSSGFAVILACLERLGPEGHVLLSRLPDRVLTVVEMLGLGPVLDIVADEHEAREHLWGEPQ